MWWSVNVGEMLRKEYVEEEAENRRMLQIILSSIRHIGRQGLAMRYKTGDDTAESDFNFIQLLKTRAEDNPSLNEKFPVKFSSPCRYTE